MARAEELRLMAKVARLYYEQHFTQPQIADQLSISQATVSRLLKRAEAEGIVRITVNQPPGAYPELEERLQIRFNLKDVVVADCLSEREEDILRGIGSAAAFYLESTIEPGAVVGISSWSATLLAMVDALQRRARPSGVQVVQILGGVGSPGSEVHAANLTRRLAERLGGEAVFLPAPGVLPSVEAAAVYQQDPFVRQAVALFEQVTLALVGIGAVVPSQMLAASGNVFSPAELAELRALGAVGDLCLRFFDHQGGRILHPLDERVMGMRLDRLRRVRRGVGVAGGGRKREAILGALRGGWVNVLITDCFTAEALAG